MISQLSRNEHFFRVVFLVVQISMKFCLWLIPSINHVPFDTQPHTWMRLVLIPTSCACWRVTRPPQMELFLLLLLLSLLSLLLLLLHLWSSVLGGKKCQNCQKQLATSCLGRASTVKMCLSWSTVMVPPSTTFMLGNTLRLGCFRVRRFPCYHPGGHLNVGDSPKSSDVRSNLDLQKLK